MPVAAVSRYFGVSRSTISRLQGRLATTGSVADRSPTGRPLETSASEDRHIRTTHLRRQFKSASSTAREWVGSNDIGRHTVSRRLREVGLRCRRPCKKKFLSDNNKVTRLAFARKKVRWTQQQWSQVVFSDESPFPIERHDGRLRCYRRPGERLAPNCVTTVRDKRSVHVWGAVSINGKSQLVQTRGNMNNVRYQNEIINQHVLPLVQRIPGQIFSSKTTLPLIEHGQR